MTIDGTDLSRFRTIVTKGGMNSLLEFPTLKAPTQNNWYEEDGIEIDLSAPKLDVRGVELSFAVVGRGNLNAFLTLWQTRTAFHTLEDDCLPRAYRLRLLSSEITALGLDPQNEPLYLIKLRLQEDAQPQAEKTSVTAQETMLPRSGWEIDSRDLAAYGLRVLQGAVKSADARPAVKQNLLISITAQHGATYDNAPQRMESRDVTIPLLLVDTDRERLWQNYNALFALLTQPKARKLTTPTHRRNLPCYYKRMAVTEFFPDAHRTWLTFELTLTLIDGGAGE